MSSKPIRFLAKATSLTRQGRLVEATRILQKALPAAIVKTPTAEAVGKSIASRFGWASGVPARPGATPADRPVSARPAAARPFNARPSTPRGDATRDFTVDGTAEAAAGGSFTTHSYAHAGLTRQYKLYVPSAPATRRSLVVMLHGCTQDADDFAAGTNMNAFAARDGFFVVYPQQSRDANPQACWNWFNTKDQQRGAGEAGFLAALIGAIAAEHGIDPGHVFVAGLSAGGAMAAIVASEYPELIAAAGIHSGLPAGAAGNLPDALTAMRSGGGRKVAASGRGDRTPVPTIVFHGDADRTVHVSNAGQVVSAVLDRAAGPTTATTSESLGGGAGRYTRTDHVDGSGTTIAEHWLLHGAGHAWSGGDARGSYVDPTGIDASAEMVRFFAEHAK